jgi:hypothetical protein
MHASGTGEKENIMKRIFGALLAGAILAALVILVPTSRHSVPAVYASSGCTNAALAGNYAFSNPGFTTPTKSVTGEEDPFATVGVLAFDGVGGVSVSYTLAFKGKISPGQTGTGTYTVNSDCTGSISFPTIVDFNTVIIGGGAEIFGIETTPSFTGTFDAKKQ